VGQRARPDAARQFYRKYIDVKGMLGRRCGRSCRFWLCSALIPSSPFDGCRPDVIESMVKNRMYLIIIGKDQSIPTCPRPPPPEPAYQN